MQLVRFNPNRNPFHFGRRMDTVFDDFFSDFLDGTRSDALQGVSPKVDVFEKEDHIVMKAELPGVDRDDIAIDVNGRVLTLKGERSHENEVKEDNYTLRERAYGTFQRSFTLPAETDSEKIKAEYKNGVLKLNIPKPASGKTKKIAIQ